MAASGEHIGGHHMAHDENVDHQGNANFAVWLGLIAITFMTSTFVGTNVYLRGWNPSKFAVNFSNSLLQKDIPYYDVLFLIISAMIVIVAGFFFAKNMWRVFNAVLALATLAFVASLIMSFDLMMWFINDSPQVATIYAPTATIDFLLTFICVILLAVAGWYTAFANKTKINRFFPVAMNVWLYTMFSTVIITLLEHVMTVGQFAAWCGQHLT